MDTTKPQASSPDPVDKKPINLLAISSSTASSIADSSGEVPPPVNKLPVPQNIDTEDNPPSPSQSTTKENGAKQPSTSNKKDNNAPLDKNSEDILGPDQLQVPGENDDYPVSPNLDGSEEMIPYAAGNDENIAKSKPDAKNTNSQNINQEQDTPNRKETFKYHSKLEKYEETEDGGYFNYFVFITTFLVLLLLAYHNKRRVIFILCDIEFYRCTDCLKKLKTYFCFAVGCLYRGGTQTSRITLSEKIFIRFWNFLSEIGKQF